MKIDGKEIAQKILEDLKNKVQKLRVIPHLAIVLIGNDPASISYIQQKDLKAEKIGAKTTLINLEFTIQNSELIEVIRKLNTDNKVHGIIVQRPLPTHIDSQLVSLAIDPRKDVDGFHPNSKFQPPISLAIFEILRSLNINPAEKNIIIAGKGETGGQPIAQSLKKIGIEPTVIDSKTENSENITKNADIIISAVGRPQVIKPDMIKRGVVLISIGLHKGTDNKLHGDYEESEIKNIASFYTPTPGGVGPVNVSMLLKNLVMSVGNLD